MIQSAKRLLLRVAGLLFFGLGTLGAFVPLLPTVPLWILAAFFFAGSSPELRQRVYEHPQFGDTVRHFVEQGALTRRSKFLAIGGASLGSAASLLILSPPGLVTWPIVGLMACVVIWLATRPPPDYGRTVENVSPRNISQG